MSEICECGQPEWKHKDKWYCNIVCKKFKAKNHSPLTNPELDSVSRIDEDKPEEICASLSSGTQNHSPSRGARREGTSYKKDSPNK